MLIRNVLINVSSYCINLTAPIITVKMVIFWITTSAQHVIMQTRHTRWSSWSHAQPSLTAECFHVSTHRTTPNSVNHRHLGVWTYRFQPSCLSISNQHSNVFQGTSTVANCDTAIGNRVSNSPVQRWH